MNIHSSLAVYIHMPEVLFKFPETKLKNRKEFKYKIAFTDIFLNLKLRSYERNAIFSSTFCSKHKN